MEPPAPLYEHVPLMTDGSTSRVVYIWPGTGEERIECDFLEVPILAKANYTAFSYVWGEPTMCNFVYHLDRVIGITENLCHVLMRLRHPSKVGSFWIDALCIDQRQESTEKAMQIPLMRQIYQNAALVVIYLGPEANQSERFPDLCRKIRRALTSADEMRESVDKENPTGPKDELLIPPAKYTSFGLPDRDSKDWLIFYHLLSRAWFTRIWVIQEAILSTSAVICCGNWFLDFENFYYIVQGSFRERLPIILPPIDEENQPQPENKAKWSVKILIFMKYRGAGTNKFIPWDLIHLLQWTRESSATLPHDYCYGLLGLSKESGDDALKVDYSIPPEDLYKSLAKHFVVNGHGINVLYNARRQGLDLPSWVPDWSCRKPSGPELCPLPMDLPLEENLSCSAASSYPVSIGLNKNTLNGLKVQGLIFDRVSALGRVFQHPRSVNQSLNSGVLGDLQEPSTIREDLESEQVHGHLFLEHWLVANCLNELYQILGDIKSAIYPTKEDDRTVISRTLLCNRKLNSTAKASKDLIECIRAFTTSMSSRDESWKMPSDLEQYHYQNQFFESGPHREEVMSKAVLFINASYEWCFSKRRGRTKRGYIGQFPNHACVGDMIFIPLGSVIPFLIRQKGIEDETCELIEECYVHGIMEGEAFHVEGTTIKDVVLV